MIQDALFSMLQVEFRVHGPQDTESTIELRSQDLGTCQATAGDQDRESRKLSSNNTL